MSQNIDLRSYENKLALIKDRVCSVAHHYTHGFFLYGPGGSGKSFAVKEVLSSIKVPWMLSNSDMSAAGLFELLYDYPNHIHVLEDLEQLYSDRKAVGYLRSATWGDAYGNNRILTKTINKKRLSLEFKGGIVILSNTPLGQLPQLTALASRLNPAEFSPTEDEKKALMRKIASGGKFGINSEACKEVCEFIIEKIESYKERCLDLRLLDAALKDRKMYDCGECHSHWHDLVASRIESLIIEPQHQPRTRRAMVVNEQDIAKQIFNLYPDSRNDRKREWTTRTGKSERALYRRAAELGLEEPKPSKVISLKLIDTERFVQGS